MSFFKRPLFYTAILAALILGVARSVLPAPSPPKDSVLHVASNARDKIFLGGQIVSDVEHKESTYGGTHAAFILKSAKYWMGLDADGHVVSGKVRVVCEDPRENFEYGDRLVLEGDLDPIPAVRNPGGFDARSYWARQGVVASLKVKKQAAYKVLARGTGHAAKSAVIRLRQSLSDALSRDFEPQKAAFLKALFLGERSGLDEDTKDLFIRTGTMHLLAVSGFNMGFLFAVLWLLLKPFPISRDPKLIIILCALWSYTALVGWQPPVIRASVMATAVITARLIGRKTDTLNLLGLAALVILSIRPADVLDIGFQLSFIAVWGMAAFTPVFLAPPHYLPHEKPTFFEKSCHHAKELFWISFICLVVTLPVTVQNFYILTPWSLITNVLVVPLSFMIFLMGTLYFLTLPILPGDWLIVQMIRALIEIFLRILDLFESIPGAVVTVGKLSVVLWSVLVAGLFYLLVSRRFRTPMRRAVSIMVFTIVIFLAQETLRLQRPHWTVHMLDVGQGDAIFMEFPKKGYWLVDGGSGMPDQGRRVIAPFLRSKGIRRLDAVIVSHPQQDHVGGLIHVLEEFKVDEVLHNGRPYPSEIYQTFLRTIEHKKVKSTAAVAGDVYTPVDGLKVQVLHPDKSEAVSANVNEDSLVLSVEYGQNRLLLTGDIEDKGLEALLTRGADLQTDILKFPHHGAKVGPEGQRLIERCQPEWVLISVGAKNPFGHPHPSALKVLSGLPEDRILRTDREGAVALRSDGERFWRA